MAKTTNDVLNKVLTGLRSDEAGRTATTITDEYELLLLQFINKAKEEVEDAWDWQALRTTVTITLAASTSSYALTSAGDADVDVSERSRLIYEGRDVFGSPVWSSDRASFPNMRPMVFDTTDSSENQLAELPLEVMEAQHFTDNDETSNPSEFAITRDSDNIIMLMYPTPGSVRTLKARFVIPQDPLPATATDSTNLTVPFTPVWTRALEMATLERGEEIGTRHDELRKQADDALYNAIAREMTASEATGSPV